MSSVHSVNRGRLRHSDHTDAPGNLTGIDKQPVSGPVGIRAPGPKGAGGSGVDGDRIGDQRHHGGDDQAVYAYAREALDTWSAELGRPLANGSFGENLTLVGMDINQARIGEHWRVGAEVVLEVCTPRIPCRTFAGWLEQRGWVKRFTERAIPGTYLRVVNPGQVEAGDPVEVIARPDHDITVELTFRALTREPELLPRLLEAPALPEEERQRASRRTTIELDGD